MIVPVARFVVINVTHRVRLVHVMKKHPAECVAQALGIKVADVYLAKHRIGALVRQELRRLERQML